ncbi:MAG: cysteine desulfurase NifS [Armatimonadota bacterium]|nr:cysteine desulfurase NifS [Armatimonadota bacterium]MDW8103491.1 cysteine desulfurase NifS [Armatimonadota bacterium]MDW8289283.1 cysteine desulfurase NifS [Armatimonadota bacterium]
MLPVYLDHSATTPLAPEVLQAMLPYLQHAFGNPSAIYTAGQEAREAVERAREQVAQLVNADPDDVYFTSGGTESDNWAVKGVVRAWGSRRSHLITTSIEHHAVLEACEAVREMGWEVTLLPVDRYGMVDPDEVRRAITPRTGLISIMHANNEVGTIEPIAEIGAIAREHGIPFHTDAVQTVGRIPVDMQALNVDLLTISAHKLYGPKGVGALVVRRGTPLRPLLDGGGQERGRRGGTYNVPGIVGFGAAAERALLHMAEETERIRALRDRLVQGILERVPDAVLTGHPTQRLPNNAHLAFADVEGETLVLSLDAAGIYCSAGAACSSGDTEPSHVLVAMGIEPRLIEGSVRFTLGKDNTEEQIDYTVEQVAKAVQKLRSLRVSR